MQPFQPPLSTASLPPVGGSLGPLPAHFVVEEIPAYLPSGEGDHVYVFVQKTLQNTVDVARRIAQVAGVQQRDVGYAGLKDRKAVTRQWFSLPLRSKPVAEWELGPDIVVLESSRHKNKLRTGHLNGNRFILTLEGVTAGGLERAEAIAARLRDPGIPNYFGPQRFGRGGSNLDAGLAWLQSMQNRAELPEGETGARRGDRRGPRSRFDDKMLPSVVQSEIFNRYVAARLARPEPLLTGEVVRLDGSSRCFVVENAEKELPRLESGDIHLTGPMIGPKTVQAEALAGELEALIVRDFGLDEGALEQLGKNAPGARRDLFLKPTDLVVRSLTEDSLELTFGLPAGSYATQVLREMTHGEWHEPR